jgi:hypothetical protein
MDDLQTLENRLQALVMRWDELAATAHRQGIDEQELYFHGVELGFEVARDQLSQVIAEIIQLRTRPHNRPN